MVFTPGNWIDQPDNYVTVGLDGTVSLDGTRYTGTMTD